MKFSRGKLAGEILSRLEKGQDAERISREVGAFLVDSGKTSELNSLLRDIIEQRAQNKGIVEVTATSAFPLTAEHKQIIEKSAKKQYPNAQSVIIDHNLDPDVIGGISLSYANSSLDMTIRGKLNRLRVLAS